MDLFHCNICSKQPGPPENRKYILGSCGHIFCDVCEHVKEESKCKICQVSSKFLLLNNDIPSNIKIYFSDLTKEIKKEFRTLHIRLKQCKIYMEEYVPQLEMKYMSAKVTIDRQNVHIEKMTNDVKKLKSEIEDLKRECRNIKAKPSYAIPQTPPSSRRVGKDRVFSLDQSPISSEIFTRVGDSSSNSNGNFFLSPADSLPNRSTPVSSALELIQNKQGLRGWNATPKTTSRRNNQIFSTSSQQSNIFTNRSSRTPTANKWNSSLPLKKSPFLSKTSGYNSSFHVSTIPQTQPK